MPIEVFSDTLCPWCWVEKRSIEAAMRRYQAKHPDVDFELVWRSFCLNPLLKTSESSLPPLFLCTPPPALPMSSLGEDAMAATGYEKQRGLGQD